MKEGKYLKDFHIVQNRRRNYRKEDQKGRNEE